MHDDNDEVLNFVECAAVLKMKVSALDRYTAARAIPCVRIRGRRAITFSKRDVLAWWAAQKTPATGEVPKRKRKTPSTVATTRQNVSQSDRERPQDVFQPELSGNMPGRENGNSHS
jgi:predicted DNA-binding transcriptional regulator AlpA